MIVSCVLLGIGSSNASYSVSSRLKMNKFLLFLSGLLLACNPVVVFAQSQTEPEIPPPTMTPPQSTAAYWLNMGALKRLNLSDTQKAQIEKLLQAERQKDAPVLDQLRALEDQLSDAMFVNDNTREQSVYAEMVALAPKLEQLQQLQQKTYQQIQSVLTPDQLTELQRRREQYKQYQYHS